MSNDVVRRVGQVFVVGRLPTITYNPREKLGLEQQLDEYLEDRGTLLSVSGPTKTGKTTLLKSVTDDAIWLSGGDMSSKEDFWRRVSEEIDSESLETTDPKLNLSRIKRDLLATDRCLVVDDFHYIGQDVQLAIVRSLKDLVFDGLAVIFASVPHRAYDAVRVEKEMTGRVTHLGISAWDDDELRSIARKGFRALNLNDLNDSLSRKLSKESFSSPHLMQQFCKRLCQDNGISETAPTVTDLRAPHSWADFFQKNAADASKTAFDLLAQGPRRRTDRIQRELQDGGKVDIYGAVLEAIAHTGPELSIGYDQLRASLRDVLSSEVPQRHEVTRVLDQMTKIAKEDIEGEPVVDYDGGLSTLHISDPYFAFYLRWGHADRTASSE
ncbi:ATP-binding protein [Streptomyces sp. NPDC005355]|uniref:ATP-binding protein n=1 Tax=Streptomyces sp. NPDC005355 TaxID=3157038 RepID=UPI0033AB778A